VAFTCGAPSNGVGGVTLSPGPCVPKATGLVYRSSRRYLACRRFICAPKGQDGSWRCGKAYG